MESLSSTVTISDFSSLAEEERESIKDIFRAGGRFRDLQGRDGVWDSDPPLSILDLQALRLILEAKLQGYQVSFRGDGVHFTYKLEPF